MSSVRLERAIRSRENHMMMVHEKVRKLLAGERLYLKYLAENKSDKIPPGTDTAIIELLDKMGIHDCSWNFSGDFKKAVETINSSYGTMKKLYSALNESEFSVFKEKCETDRRSCPLSNNILEVVEKERAEASKNPLSELLGS